MPLWNLGGGVEEEEEEEDKDGEEMEAMVALMGKEQMKIDIDLI